MIPRRLISFNDKKMLIRHLQQLEDEDKRLRFGVVLKDEAIKNYVNNSWEEQDSIWFGCTSNGKVIAACHVAIDIKEAELGCSVDSDYRSRGLAQAMFDRAVTYLRAHDVKEVYMHCLTENAVMRHIAKKNDMTIVSCNGETDAKVLVEPATPLTTYHDAYLDRIAIYDMLIRSQTELYGKWLESFKYVKEKGTGIK